jgi:hypothetical protein
MSAGTSDTPTPKEWSVRILISERDGGTRAEARLDTGAATVTGTGSARLSPMDHDVPGIGDELAVGRALSNVASGLLQAAEEDADEIHRRRYAGKHGHRMRC